VNQAFLSTIFLVNKILELDFVSAASQEDFGLQAFVTVVDGVDIIYFDA
jgi:hypothetical protein